MICIYATAEQMVRSELPPTIRSSIFSIVKMGDIVYQDILNFQRSTFNSQYLDSIKSRIKTKIIYRQFDDDMLSKDFPFTCTKLKVNNFGDKVPELSRGNILLHFAYSREKDVLPKRAQYKAKRAIFNRPFDRQIMYNIVNIDNKTVLDEKNVTIEVPYYAIVVFGGTDAAGFVDLIVPSSDYSSISYSLNLKNELRIVDLSNEDEADEAVRKRRIKLRDDIMDQLKKESL